MNRAETPPLDVSRLLVGLVVAAMGAAFLLDELDLLDLDQWRDYWPLAVVAIGVALLLGGRRQRGWGLLWVAAGGWSLLHELGLVRASVLQIFWPAILLLLGGIFVVRALRPRAPRTEAAVGVDPGRVVNALALLSGVQRTSSSPQFQGGSATAVMGGCEIFLRQAHIAGPIAEFEVLAVWGGVELRVPETWRVDCRALGILGGVEDKTRPPADPQAPTLVLRGFAIMGGVEISN